MPDTPLRRWAPKALLSRAHPNVVVVAFANKITAFRHHLVDRWLHAIRRRGQKHRLAWPRMKTIANRYLPYPRILHPWPEQRFLVNHPR